MLVGGGDIWGKEAETGDITTFLLECGKKKKRSGPIFQTES